MYGGLPACIPSRDVGHFPNSECCAATIPRSTPPCGPDPTHSGHHLNTMGDIYCLIWRLPPYHSYSHGLFSANNVPGINTFSINDRKLGDLGFGVRFRHKRCLVDLMRNHFLGRNSPFDPYGNNCKRATALESSRSLRI